MIISDYINYIEKVLRYSPRTVSTYKKNLGYFEQYLNENELTDTDISPRDIGQWIMVLMDRGLQPRSVNLSLSCLRSYYTWCCRFAGYTNNPAVCVKDVRSPKFLPTFITEKLMNKLIDELLPSDTFKQMRSRIVILIFYHCGLRCTELSHLKDTDINLERDYMRVFGKGQKERIIPFGRELHNEITRYLVMRDSCVPRDVNPCFIKTSFGTNCTDGNIRLLTKMALSQIVPPAIAHPHVLRHTFATHLMNHGAKIENVAALLGHASITTTSIYQHVSVEYLRETYKKVFDNR